MIMLPKIDKFIAETRYLDWMSNAQRNGIRKGIGNVLGNVVRNGVVNEFQIETRYEVQNGKRNGLYQNGKIQAKRQYDGTLTERKVLFLYKLLPFMVYWFVLWLILVFIAHVQISTRFLCSSCPPFYWFCAEIILRKEDHSVKGYIKDSDKRMVIVYFALYFVIGTMAFCAYLPFV